MGTSLYHWLDKIIKPTLPCGRVLEIGPGWIWPGLKLLKQNSHMDLIIAGYESEQQQAALDQARQLGVRSRVSVAHQTGGTISLPDQSVDGVISFGGLHQWDNPGHMLDEIRRVLKHQGAYFIGDVRGDQPLWEQWFNFNRQAAIKNLYRQRKKSWTLPRLQDLIACCHLDQAALEGTGPDLWILSLAHRKPSVSSSS